jgi:predicted CoA-substrate-specific enzyme activase
MGEIQALCCPQSAYRVGIDIGSVTAKVVVLDLQGQIIFSEYRRHKAEIRATLVAIFRNALECLGDVPASVLITGSAGMGVSERYGLPFIQEMIASAEAVKKLYPCVRTVIDIGGEDAKLIYFEENGAPDIRMNGSCAGGTGAYIDEMATLLNVSIRELNSLAEQHTQIYPMASRCGVFGKTDIQNLLSRAVDRADIAASILNAVVLQILATLARGLEPRPHYLFSGGPLTFVPALRSAFIQALGLGPDEVTNAPHMELLPAIGAAMTENRGRPVFGLSQLADRLSREPRASSGETHRLAPLFKDEAEWRQWEDARAQYRLPRAPLSEVEGQPCFLGVDSGSTTSKALLIDALGRVIFSFYANNNGNAIQTLLAGLEKLKEGLAACAQPPQIMHTAVTGYGEDLISTAFGLDEGVVETLAHYRAAKAFDPQVTFILDIGGQDMKAVFVREGLISNIEINEACSSGCGTFIETYARSLGYTVTDFAHKACLSSAPCNLGTRCTVFMNSSIKQSLKEGADIGDISAGLAFSVIKNALHKVLRISDTTVLGEHIVVQGGTFRNPAVHRALEILLERPVVCPDMAELMGAYGAALTARDAWLKNGRRPTQFKGFDTLNTSGRYDKRTLVCRGCENRCSITKLLFDNGGIFYSGNRCERIYTNHGDKFAKGASLTHTKLDLLFNRPTQPAGNYSQTIGIPRVMNLYEDYPFWNTLLVECGFKVQLSDVSTTDLFSRGASTVMSENICFPAKVVHGHIQNLIEKGVERIFYPMVFAEHKEFVDAFNSFNCPIVTGYPDVIRNAIDPANKAGIPLDMPAVTFRDKKLLRQACYQYVHQLGIDSRRFQRAFRRALAAQHQYKAAVRAAGADLLENAQKEGRLVILLLSRPYHLDPLTNHGIPQILADLGVDVITEDAVPLDEQATLDKKDFPTQWESVNRFYYAARWVGRQPGVEVVQLNSFACGPDAYTQDEVKRMLHALGKSYTAIRIDEIESTGSTRLRLRSLVETLKAEERRQPLPKPGSSLKVYEASDRHKVILTPYFSHFCAPPIAGPIIQMGYQVETLPPPDRQSVEIGLKYTQNEICYPGIILIGDVIKALQSGKYPVDNVAVGSWQTGGPCRATSILSLTRQALIAAGYPQVPIVALTINPKLVEQPGFDLNMLEYIPKAFLAIAYSDALSAYYHATAIREVNPGQALALANELLAPLYAGVLPLDQSSIMARLRDAVARFNDIPTVDRLFPRVGIVGEIYLKYNSFSNNDVARWLMSQGVEVVLPPFLEFFLGSFVSAQVRVKENLDRRGLAWLLAKCLEWRVQNVLDQVEQISEGFKHHRPSRSIQDIAREAAKIVSLTHAYGEGWLIAGETGIMAEQGVPNVLCLQPFGCIANQVVARGAAKRLKEEYRNLNLLFLDLDASASEVNYFNRLHFFVSHAKSTAPKEGSPSIEWRPLSSAERG